MSLKNQYSRKVSHILEIVSIVISLFVYFYISKAFSSSVDDAISSFGGSYFDYVVFGEIFMMLPLYFLDAPYKKIKSSIVEGSFDIYLSLPITLNRLIFILCSWNLVQVLKRVILTFLIASLFFDFSMNYASLPQLIILQIVSILPFLGLGLCVSCLILFFGRGESALGYLNTIISISAGSFFPLSVLPQWLQDSSRLLSPFTILLENSRYILNSPLGLMDFSKVVFVLLVWGCFIFLGRYLLKRAINSYRKNGKLAVISHY
jgi:ABC-2 type transport system permease protein